MKGKVWDSPTRIMVESESDSNDAYLVELTDFPVGDVLNGSCQCRHFVCKLRPLLLDPRNTTPKRCKHLLWAREHALDMILPHFKKADKNLPDEATI